MGGNSKRTAYSSISWRIKGAMIMHWNPLFRQGMRMVLSQSTFSRLSLSLELRRRCSSGKHRSLLGHLRHESGHYFWYLMRDNEFLTNQFEKLFDSPNIDYDLALESYYEMELNQPGGKEYITPYASSHPFEDWAETWSHYLHLIDGLETRRI